MIIILLILLLLHLIILINWQFTLWPEMVVYPYLVNNNFLLYKDLINPYPPTVPVLLSFFTKILGYNPEPYKFLTWGIILIVDICIYIISRKMFKKNNIAAISTIFFIFSSIPFGVNGLWFDLIQTPLMLISVYFFYCWLKSKKNHNLTFSLIMLLLAFEIKQQVAWLGALYLGILIYEFKKNFFGLIKNINIPLLIFFVFTLSQALYFQQKGVLGDFLFWVFYFPFIKASQMPGYVAFPNVKQLFAPLALILLITPFIFSADFKKRFLAICAILSMFFAYPRFDYFHLITALSIASIIFGNNIIRVLKNISWQTAFLLIGLSYLTIFNVRFYQRNFTANVRFFEKDIYTAADLISILTPSGKPIYMQNSPDQLFVLARRLPPKPWADELSWYLELPGIQQKIVSNIKQQNPQFIVFQPYEGKGKYELGSYRPQKIADYLDNNYQNYAQISPNLWLKEKIQ